MKNQFYLIRPYAKERHSGFTLIELVVVLACTTALALTALPVRSNAKVAANAMTCQNNLRQLTSGWRIYSMDNRDKVCQTGGMGVLCTDPNDPSFRPGGAKANWVLGSVDTKPGNTDERYIKNGLLYAYVGEIAPYKCPLDRRTDAFPGTGGKPTLRSYSMNCWLNPISPWSANQPGITNFRKQGDIKRPAQTFVLAEENPGTINDGWLICDPMQATWVDVPAAYHDGIGNLSFADGHIEARKWTDPALLRTNIVSPNVSTEDPAQADLKWLQTRSTY